MGEPKTEAANWQAVVFPVELSFTRLTIKFSTDNSFEIKPMVAEAHPMITASSRGVYP